jgi:hypothetical protein
LENLIQAGLNADMMIESVLSKLKIRPGSRLAGAVDFSSSKVGLWQKLFLPGEPNEWDDPIRKCIQLATNFYDKIKVIKLKLRLGITGRPAPGLLPR